MIEKFFAETLLEKYCNGSGMDLEWTNKDMRITRLAFTFFDRSDNTMYEVILCECYIFVFINRMILPEKEFGKQLARLHVAGFKQEGTSLILCLERRTMSTF